MVGSRKAGSMVDNDVEGWPGYIIDQVHDKGHQSAPVWKPNVFLINAGTNDCIQNVNITTAGTRLRKLVHDMVADSPEATIILSSLLVNGDSATEARVQIVNPQIQDLVNDFRMAGVRVIYAEMHGPDGPQVSDLVDGTHPNDGGYAKMAAIWYNALVDASNLGFLQTAESVPGVPDNGGPVRNQKTSTMYIS
jgi:lysophospholipase L1-like esterase